MPRYDHSARKRPVNLRLNEDLVARVRELTGNLSGVVESLLTDYVERSGLERDERRRALAATLKMWNAHTEANGSFADEYSPL